MLHCIGVSRAPHRQHQNNGEHLQMLPVKRVKVCFDREKKTKGESVLAQTLRRRRPPKQTHVSSPYSASWHAGIRPLLITTLVALRRRPAVPHGEHHPCRGGWGKHQGGSARCVHSGCHFGPLQNAYVSVCVVRLCLRWPLRNQLAFPAP